MPSSSAVQTDFFAQFTAALDTSGLGFFTCDEQGRINLATPLAETLLGLQQNGTDYKITSRLRRASGESLDSICGGASAGLPMLLHVDGGNEPRIVKVTGNADSRAFLIQDISNELEGASGDREALDVVAHDLRAGLVPAKTYAQMLLGGMLGPVTEKQTEALRSIDICIQKQDTRIGAVLDMVKAEEERLEPQLETLSLIDIVKPALAQIERDSTRKGLKLIADLDESTALVEADSRRLQRILTTLLLRSVKHTPGGGEIGLELHYLADNRARIRIWDTGAGTPAEELSLMQMSAPRQAEERVRLKRPPDLETASIFDIIKLHQGSFSARAIEGAGTTYTIYLPTQRRSSATPTPNGSTGELSALLVGPADQTSPLSTQLESKSIRIVEAADDRGAIVAARRQHFTLVFIAETLQGIPAPEVEKAIAAERPEDVQARIVITPGADAASQIKDALARIRP